MESVLVVDDDRGFQQLLTTILESEGYRVEAAASVGEARRALARRQFHLALTDLRLPDGDGLAVLDHIQEYSPETPVILITAFGSVNSAVDAMKRGAADYLTKPLASPDELRVLVRRTLDERYKEGERELLRQREQARFGCASLIAEDSRMVKLLEMAAKVAPTNATVCLFGESGTGKEILARCIHENSARAGRAFVPVNCAALSPTLIESELFGHEKGAFTGAVQQHIGLFERAHGGTLFLDEIGELDANLQAKLLRVLQEKTFERVGGTRQIQVDVRVLVATHRDLKQLTAEGRFREDLYYRLVQFPLEIPPLRERGGDIVRLARFFLNRATRNLGKPPLILTTAAEQALSGYSWPGNVRELENLMERVAILCEERVDAADLPIAALQAPRPTSLDELERKAIEEALRRHEGNRARAARELGISLRTLQYRLKEYGLAGRARHSA
jgi:DNA-binding NtrC family response regulator